MNTNPSPACVDLLDVSACSYAQRLSAAALQGLVNRSGPALFLDYGIYDDPAARRTNEIFMEDDLWYGKYRALLGNQDQRNLAYYREAHGVQVRTAASLEEIIRKYAGQVKGCVVWDAEMPDTANIALMLAAQEDLLPVEHRRGRLRHARGAGAVPQRHRRTEPHQRAGIQPSGDGRR